MLSCLVIGLTGPVMRVNNCCLHVNPDASSSSKSHHFWNPLFVDVVAVKITDRGQVFLLELLLEKMIGFFPLKGHSEMFKL